MRIEEAIMMLPLKEMDGTLLAAAVIDSAPAVMKEDITDAVKMAAFFHRGATRANRGIMPRDHYVTHPLRNTLRLMRWGVEDLSVLVAELLHDTVEDSAEDMVRTLAGREPQDAQREALELVGERFGDRVRVILHGVTNPETEGLDKASKNELYRVHVLEKAGADDGVLLVKVSDFIDNAGSLHHNIETHQDMVAKRVFKYKPLAQPLIDLVERSGIETSIKEQMLEQLRRVLARLEAYDGSTESMLSAS